MRTLTALSNAWCLLGVVWLGSVGAQSLPHASPTALPQPLHQDQDATAPRPLARAAFGLETASLAAQQMADWVLQSGDHRGDPFIVVDKIHAQVFVFNSAGHLQGAAPALLGLAPGDDAVAGLGDRPMALILPHERTTPAGRFVATLARNLAGQQILWVDYEQGISLHPLRSVNASERRAERLASLTVQDNRISFGCINVPPSFFRQVVVAAFAATQGVVYVLPEILPMPAVFPMPSTKSSQ